MVDSIQQLEKYSKISNDLPHLKAIVLYGQESIPANTEVSVKLYHLDRFIKLGLEISDEALKQRTESWKAGETCELIYTVRLQRVRHRQV